MIIKLQWKNYEGDGSHVSFDSEEIASIIEAKEGNARVTLKNGYSMTAVEDHATVHRLWVQGRERAEALRSGQRLAPIPPDPGPMEDPNDIPPADWYDDKWGG